MALRAHLRPALNPHEDVPQLADQSLAWVIGVRPFFRSRKDGMTKTIVRIILEWDTLRSKGFLCYSGCSSNSLTQVGIHFACSLPKPFLACAFKRSSWLFRSLTMRISKQQELLHPHLFPCCSIGASNHLLSARWSCPSSSFLARELTGTTCGLLLIKSAEVT